MHCLLTPQHQHAGDDYLQLSTNMKRKESSACTLTVTSQNTKPTAIGTSATVQSTQSAQLARRHLPHRDLRLGHHGAHHWHHAQPSPSTAASRLPRVHMRAHPVDQIEADHLDSWRSSRRQHRRASAATARLPGPYLLIHPGPPVRVRVWARHGRGQGCLPTSRPRRCTVAGPWQRHPVCGRRVL